MKIIIELTNNMNENLDISLFNAVENIYRANYGMPYLDEKFFTNKTYIVYDNDVKKEIKYSKLLLHLYKYNINCSLDFSKYFEKFGMKISNSNFFEQEPKINLKELTAVIPIDYFTNIEIDINPKSKVILEFNVISFEKI